MPLSSPFTVNLIVTFVPDFDNQQPIISLTPNTQPYGSDFPFSHLVPVEQKPNEFKSSPSGR